MVIEFDSQVAIQMVNGDREVDAEVEVSFRHPNCATRTMGSTVCFFSPRNSNKAAQDSFACRECGSFYWEFIPPSWLFNTLADNANVISSRL